MREGLIPEDVTVVCVATGLLLKWHDALTNWRKTVSKTVRRKNMKVEEKLKELGVTCPNLLSPWHHVPFENRESDFISAKTAGLTVS